MACAAPLTGDEIALYRKLVLREAREYLCLGCLASQLGNSREELQQLIDYYHKTGYCCLFVKTEGA